MDPHSLPFPQRLLCRPFPSRLLWLKLSLTREDQEPKISKEVSFRLLADSSPLQAKSASLETARASSAVGVYCPGEGCSAVVTRVPQAGSPQLGRARQAAEANPGPAWPAPSLVRQPGASATYGSRNQNTQHRMPRNRDALFSQNQEEIRERDTMQSYQERHSAPCCYMDEPLKAWCAVK